jgi:tRNA pseudouridine38-40 synthase
MEQASEKPDVPMANNDSARDRSPPDHDRKRKRDDRDGGGRGRGRGRGGRGGLQHGSHQHKKRNMGRKEHL